MEIYDIVMIVVLVGAMLFGAIKGFAWQLASIASILGSYFVALQFREPFSQSIKADPPWNRFLAMLILYIGAALLIWVAFRMVSGSIDRLKLKEFDRHIGAIFGLIKGCLYCILITLFAVTLSGQTVRESVVRSKSGNYIAKVLDKSESVIPPEIHDVIGPYLERFDREFDQSGNPAGWFAGDVAASPVPNTAPNAAPNKATNVPPATFDPQQWSIEQTRQAAGQAIQDGFQR